KKPLLLSCTYPDLTATLSPERDMNKIIRDKPSKRFNHYEGKFPYKKTKNLLLIRGALIFR
ncbi:hypothetical protein NB583_00005, partial [Vibrio parahaemolyticus]|uniref:hypothetical protein n=1 Tax=Vibrio harveyi group TaxID=717610 RepID=UPI00215C916A